MGLAGGMTVTKPTGSGEDGSMRASAERDWQAPTAPEPWTGGHDERGSARGRRARRPAHGRERAPRGGSSGGTRSGTIARGLTGSLAAGLVVLALGLAGVQIWSGMNGKFGPGVGVVIGHFVLGGVAVALQAVADRRRDLTGGLSALGVAVVVFGALTYWWWL